jgi:hypothetical protein
LATWAFRASRLASGTTVKQKCVSIKEGNIPVKRYRRQKKQTLAVAVGLSKLPVLPQKLLEELLPGVSSALFKRKNS